MRADLHIHTYYSDGSLSPEKVVSLAKRYDLGALSVTDHDTMLGAEEVKLCCNAAGIIPIAGAEISAYAGEVKVHTLCYCPDLNNTDFANFLDELFKNSLRRAEIIISKLNAAGIKVTFEEAARERFSDKTPLHAMHIAAACANKGYSESAGRFYSDYLAYGKPGFCNAYRPSPEKTVEIISAAGGFSSLAHPARIDMRTDEVKKLVKRMKECGLCGIEAVYSAHTDRETAYYKELANTLGLEVTGGSDTHFPQGRREIGKPAFYLEGALLQKLKNC